MIFPKPLSVAIATLSAWLVIGQTPGLAPVAQANPAHDQRLAKGEIVVDLVSKHPIYHFDVYGVVARLGLLAASLELERTDPNPEVY